MATSTGTIEPHHIEEAAAVWDRDGAYGTFGPSTKYDVLINGKPYPPKAIMAIALELAGLGARTPYNVRGAADGGLHDWYRELGFPVVTKGGARSTVAEAGRDAEMVQDIESLQNDTSLDATTREQLIQARVGQGTFRRDVLDAWSGRCAVTGCAVTQVLRASHIKPWRDSSNDERRDPDNGLPLIANLDALFDVGLIGFDEAGQMLVSSELGSHDLLNGVGRHLGDWPNASQVLYLKYHLETVFKGTPVARAADGTF